MGSVEVWESAIGEFLGSFVGVLGALFVFWLGIRHNRKQEEVRTEWEFMSVLQLLYEDILHHRNALRRYAANPETVWSYPLPPGTEMWEETRWRIAQLGGGDAWVDLTLYYSLIRVLGTWRQGPARPEAPELNSLISDLQQQNKQIISVLKETLQAGVKGQDRRNWFRRNIGWLVAVPLPILVLVGVTIYVLMARLG